jgi:NTE family protein
MTIRLQPIFLTLLLASTTTLTHADVSTNENSLHRPKVCLVLSGGGARGAAHIGVLKVLEEYRVPVDCVVGTSMGALVGGAYASGSSVAEMEQLTSSLSTQILFKDKPPREELDIRRKQEDRTLLFSPELGVGSITGSSLPKGLVSGVQLESVLRKLAAPGYLDFDKLPIPYRAVATNLVTAGKRHAREYVGPCCDYSRRD